MCSTVPTMAKGSHEQQEKRKKDLRCSSMGGLGVVDGLEVLCVGEVGYGVINVVFDALGAGCGDLTDGGVCEADGHEVAAALEAAGEVGEGAVLLLCRAADGGVEELQHGGAEGGEVCAGRECLPLPRKLHGEEEAFKVCFGFFRHGVEGGSVGSLTPCPGRLSHLLTVAVERLC